MSYSIVSNTGQSIARGQNNFNRDAKKIVNALALKSSPSNPIKARDAIEGLGIGISRASSHILHPLVENRKVVEGYRVYSKESRKCDGKLYWVLSLSDELKQLRAEIARVERVIETQQAALRDLKVNESDLVDLIESREERES